MWHTTFIAAHAVTGVVALVTGLLAMRRGRLFDVYLGSLVGMTVFLLLAIAAQWNTIGLDERVLFLAFGGLAGIMVWRAVLARRERPRAGTLPSAGYLGHVGFTVVALFDAFSVVTVLNAGAPVWAVVGTGVVIAVAGHFALGWAKHEGVRRWSTS